MRRSLDAFSPIGLGFGVWGLGFGVWVLGFGVWGLGFGCCRAPHLLLQLQQLPLQLHRAQHLPHKPPAVRVRELAETRNREHNSLLLHEVTHAVAAGEHGSEAAGAAQLACCG